MGYNARNDEIRDNVTRLRREWEAQRGVFRYTGGARAANWQWLGTPKSC
jgi:hypothetical protein